MNAIAFLIASTNLVIELGIVLWVLLGCSAGSSPSRTSFSES
jgi:hypothetical protein